MGLPEMLSVAPLQRLDADSAQDPQKDGIDNPERGIHNQLFCLQPPLSSFLPFFLSFCLPSLSLSLCLSLSLSLATDAFLHLSCFLVSFSLVPSLSLSLFDPFLHVDICKHASVYLHTRMWPAMQVARVCEWGSQAQPRYDLDEGMGHDPNAPQEMSPEEKREAGSQLGRS